MASNEGKAALRVAASNELSLYFEENPIEIDDDYLEQKVAASVYEYFQLNPVNTEVPYSSILQAVAVYLQQHPPAAGPKGDTGATGATGAVGPTGQNATAAQIAAAVAAYLTANPPQAGATGPAGQNATDAQVAAKVAEYMTANNVKGYVTLPNIVIGQTATIAILAGVRRVTSVCVGAQVGDKLLVTPTSQLPAGYMFGESICETSGQIITSVTGPALIIGAAWTSTNRVVAFR